VNCFAYVSALYTYPQNRALQYMADEWALAGVAAAFSQRL